MMCLFSQQNSLSELMDKIKSSSPHFVRCIKPNTLKQPENFEVDYVQKQLKYTGVMETVRIRQCGFPTRLTFTDFLKRFVLYCVDIHIIHTKTISSLHSVDTKC